jgi:SAM-dependent methyltransferase
MSLPAAARLDAAELPKWMPRLMDDCMPGLTTRLERGIDVLAIGAGSTLAAFADRFRDSRFFGYETRDEALDDARREIARRRLGNITVMRQDAASLPDRNAYDLVTAFDALHRQAQPAAVIGNLRRALRWHGTLFLRAMTDDRALSLLADSGFSRIAVRRHPSGNAIYYAAPKLTAAND